MGRAERTVTSGPGGWGGGVLSPLSASLARAPLSAVREEEGEGEGPLCGESGGGGGESGKVSLGEGRVKGPLPDGLLTLWCPASPIPASSLGGREDCPAFPLHPNPSPCPWSSGRSGERKLPRWVPWKRGKRGPDFKTTGTGVETEARILGVRIPLTRTRCDWREAETAGRLRRGWGRKASPESQPPRPGLARRQPVWPSGLRAPATSGGVASLWLDSRGQET